VNEPRKGSTGRGCGKARTAKGRRGEAGDGDFCFGGHQARNAAFAGGELLPGGVVGATGWSRPGVEAPRRGRADGLTCQLGHQVTLSIVGPSCQEHL
jgi:hypothetical protein